MNNNNDATMPTGLVARFLNFVERVGNKLPDPAIIFLFAMLLIGFCLGGFQASHLMQ